MSGGNAKERWAVRRIMATPRSSARRGCAWGWVGSAPAGCSRRRARGTGRRADSAAAGGSRSAPPRRLERLAAGGQDLEVVGARARNRVVGRLDACCQRCRPGGLQLVALVQVLDRGRAGWRRRRTPSSTVRSYVEDRLHLLGVGLRGSSPLEALPVEQRRQQRARRRLVEQRLGRATKVLQRERLDPDLGVDRATGRTAARATFTSSRAASSASSAARTSGAVLEELRRDPGASGGQRPVGRTSSLAAGWAAGTGHTAR
jgi:hypothetical protein